MADPSPAGVPSRFWERMQAEHRLAERDHGIEAVKRHQALRYFNWSWGWKRLPKNPQALFLLLHSTPRAWWRALRQRKDIEGRAWEDVPWAKRDRWLYVVAVRLIWQYADRHGDAAVMSLTEPELGAPLPVRLGDRLISQDLANSALETAAIDRIVDGREPPRQILEVGAGYGRNAFALLHRFEAASYTIVDIEPALSIARWYLGGLFPPERLRFVAANDAGTIDDASIDLALSVSSLQEMTVAQQVAYLELFDRVAAGGSVYLKQWRRWRNPEDDVSFTFDGMPIPARWRQLLKKRCAVQTSFTQGGWSIPGP